MAKINITVDTADGTFQVNVDGQNIPNIYDVSVYNRKASPYYDPQGSEVDDMSPVEVSFSTYQQTDSSITSQRTTFAKADITVENNAPFVSPLSDELADVLASRR